MKASFRSPLLLAILSATTLGVSGMVLAQEPVAPPETSESQTDPRTTESPDADVTSPPKAAQQIPIDEQKIDKFADAYVAVQTIQTNAAKDLDNTQDPEKQKQTQAAVENEMIAAVERTGLKLEEFNGIVQTMTADADLRARVVAKIRERTGG